MKNIQMPESFLVDVYRLIFRLEELKLDEDTKSQADNIKMQIQAKIERMERHKLYSQSKNADTEQRKEEARQKYLDKKGIHPDWRY